MAKRLISLAIFLISLVIFSISTTKIFAIDTEFRDIDSLKEYCKLRQGNQMNLETWYSGKCGGSFQERIGFADIIFMDLMTGMTGETKIKESLSSTNQNSNLSSDTFSSFGLLFANLTSTLPASSGQYFGYVNQNLARHNIVPTAYAQAPGGYGFKSLGPVIELWKVFRDMVYVLFIVSFVIYGFMIMFRAKVSSQTVVSIQTALPNLIGVLLLITFSYAIAGLIIDFSYVIQEVVLSSIFQKIESQITGTVSLGMFKLGGVLGSSGTGSVAIDSPFGRFAQPFGNDFLKTVTGFLFGKTVAPDSNASQMAPVFVGKYGGLWMPLVYIMLVISVGNAIPRVLSIMAPTTGLSAIDDSVKAFFFNPAINLIVWLVLFIAILYTFFKIAYALIQAFVMVIFNVIFSPFILLKGILPGNDAFGEWVRTLVAYLASFPATIICFTLSFIFIGRFEITSDGVKSAFLPVISFFIPSPNVSIGLNLFGLKGQPAIGTALSVPPPLGTDLGLMQLGTSGDAMITLIGIGIFLMTPKIVEMIQEALKVPPFKYGAAIGEALNFGYGPVNNLLIKPATELVSDTGKRMAYGKSQQMARNAQGGIQDPVAERVRRSLQKRGWDK